MSVVEVKCQTAEEQVARTEHVHTSQHFKQCHEHLNIHVKIVLL